MRSGYKVNWTDHALDELESVYDYMELNWSEREIKKLTIEIEKTISLISLNPRMFPELKPNVRKAIVLRLNSIFFRIIKPNSVEIVSFFQNRKNPKSRKI